MAAEAISTATIIKIKALAPVTTLLTASKVSCTRKAVIELTSRWLLILYTLIRTPYLIYVRPSEIHPPLIIFWQHLKNS